MAIKKRTDQLPAILSGDVDNNDLMYLVHENAQAETGYDSKKIFVSDVGRKLNNGVEYATELPSFPPGDQNPLDALEYLNSKINDLYPVDSASGAIANFTTSLALPLVALKTNITAQGGGGQPSAPVQITGVSSINVYRRGANLFDEETELGTINATTGENEPSTTAYRSKNYIPVKPNMQIYIVKPLVNFGLRFYDINKNFISSLVVYVNYNVTIPANCYYVRFHNTSTPNYGNDVSFNYPSTDTSYHAYNPQSDTFTLSLGQTVYGGFVDWKNGKLVVTHAIYVLDSSFDIGVADYEGNDRFVIRDFADVGKVNTDFLSSHYVMKTQSSVLPYMTMSNSAPRMWITYEKSVFSGDVSAFKTYLDNQKLNGTPVQVVYELATPIEIDLPTTMPSTISGVQNWFADSGDIELEYKMGVQEYIDKKIAEVQALIL